MLKGLRQRTAMIIMLALMMLINHAVYAVHSVIPLDVAQTNQHIEQQPPCHSSNIDTAHHHLQSSQQATEQHAHRAKPCLKQNTVQNNDQKMQLSNHHIQSQDCQDCLSYHCVFNQHVMLPLSLEFQQNLIPIIARTTLPDYQGVWSQWILSPHLPPPKVLF